MISVKYEKMRLLQTFGLNVDFSLRFSPKTITGVDIPIMVEEFNRAGKRFHPRRARLSLRESWSLVRRKWHFPYGKLSIETIVSVVE